MSGIDQLTSTLNNLKPGTKQPPSASQYASAQLREERKEEENPLEKGLYKFNDIQNRQVGSKIAESISGNPVLEGLYAVTSGMGQYAEDLNSLRYTTAQPPTANAYAAGEIRSNINWGPEIIKGQNLGQSLFDLGQTTGRLLPSILLSKAMGATQGLTIPDEELSLVKDAILKSSQKAGSLVTGVSSMGGARAQALRDGYSAGEALVYGAVNGVLEGGLEYALGGISTLGKGGTSKALSKLPVLQKLKEMLPQAIKSPAMQKALKTTGSYIARMGDEGFEEYLQAVIDPMVRNLILKEDNELDLLSDDALYAAFLGALTAGILNLPSAMTGRMSGGNAENQSLQNPLENGRMGIEGSDGYGGEAAQTDIRRNGSAVDWETGGRDGRADQANDGRTAPEMGRIREETAESFQRRASEVLQNGEIRRLDQHRTGQIAYLPAQQVAAESEAGKAELGLRKLGASVVVTEGNFETNRNGLTTLHTDAATAPDGTIYISNQTKISAEQIVSHEGLHFLQRQNSPLYNVYFDNLLSNADLLSDAYKLIAGRINKEHYGGRLDLDDPDSVIPIFTELAAYIHEWLTVDPEHAKNTFGGMFRDWDAVVEASRALREAMDRGVQTEGSGEYGGEKEIDIRQYQGSPGGLDGRGEPGDGQRSGISETVEAVPGRVQRTSIRAFTKGLVGSELTFDSVKPEFLASYQQKNVDIGEQYGYTVYYISKSSTITDGGQSITMDKVAFVIPGIKAVFAMDGTRRNFIYHELFHQFLSENRYGEQKLQKNVIKSAFRKSDAAKEYLKRYKKIYGDKVKTRDVYEEITCDLCEYALSGSQEMYNRLEGLFEPGALDALCKEARKVFAANRTGKRVGEESSQNPLSSDRNPRYYLEESAETNMGDVNNIHNLQAEKSAPSSADGNSGDVNNIHTSELLTSLREAGAYEGLSAYLLRQAIPQAEGSSLAALVRDKQAQTPGLSRTQAVQDLAAEYVNSRLFTDADAIRQLAEARPETARQILSWLRSAELPDESLIQAEKLYSQALGENDFISRNSDQLVQSNDTIKEITGAVLNDSFKGNRHPENDFINKKNQFTLKSHYDRHKGDFDFSSEYEYLQAAREFLETPATETTQSFYSTQGTYFRYNTATNEFGIINQFGGISTYFKPKEGLNYWLEQIELYAPKLNGGDMH